MQNLQHHAYPRHLYTATILPGVTFHVRLAMRTIFSVVNLACALSSQLRYVSSSCGSSRWVSNASGMYMQYYSFSFYASPCGQDESKGCESEIDSESARKQCLKKVHRGIADIRHQARSARRKKSWRGLPVASDTRLYSIIPITPRATYSRLRLRRG